MGKMMAEGEAVPITALEGVTATQAEALAEKGIADVETLATTSVDDLVDFLDISLDQAQRILQSAASIVEAKNAAVSSEVEEPSENPPAEEDPANSVPSESLEADEPATEQSVESEAPGIETVPDEETVIEESGDSGDEGEKAVD